MMTMKELARQEMSHLVAGILAVRRDYPGLLHKLVGEIHVNEAGGHCSIYASDPASEIETPGRVKRLMALGPLTIGGINSLRDLLRSKQVPEHGTAMSSADTRMAIVHGGLDLTIRDCELITGTAAIVNSEGFDDAALAVADTGTLVLPLSKWLPEEVCNKALAGCGKDFMQLHDRYRHELPAWAIAAVDRRYEAAQALSPAL